MQGRCSWEIEFSSEHTELELLDKFSGEEMEHIVKKISGNGQKMR